jgi:hypothetical protein
VSAETRALSIVNGSGDGSVGAGQAADILLLLRLVFVASEYKYEIGSLLIDSQRVQKLDT